MKYNFPKNFLFGGSFSSIQSDGQNILKTAKTNYNMLFEKSPELFFDNIGPEITSQFIKNYKTDLKLLSDIGVNALRQSFSWSKLFPDGENTTPNKEAIEYYHNLFNEMKKNNMTRFMSLMHFELPEFVVNKGGLISDTYVESFVEFVEFIFDEFADEVEYFATYNEAFVQCGSMYLSDGKQGMWPLENNIEHFIVAMNNVALSHAKIMELAKKKNLLDKVGIVIDFNPGYVRNVKNSNDTKALEYYTALREGFLLDTTLKGTTPPMYEQILKDLDLTQLSFSEKERDFLKENTAKWLGINYYGPFAIKEANGDVNENIMNKWFTHWDNPLMFMNKSRGWEIKPSALNDVITRIQNDYNNIKMFVTENGVAIQNENDYIFEGVIQDDYRIEFLKLHLIEIYKTIQNGANIQGYLMWSPIDSWSFMNAYKNRYGLISLDYQTQIRTIKKSGHWWKEMTKKGGFEYD